jgi:prepilin-type N-terminal cleavage/methylation domain-containing protein
MKKQTMTYRAATNGRGFTLLELLIAVVILGILVAIIVPVLSSRAAEARHTAALKDLESLAAAEEHVAIDTGYFTRLFVLDDVRGGDGIANESYNGNVQDRIDGLKDEGVLTENNHSVPTRLFFDTGNNVGTDGALLGENIYARAISNETSFNWNGPYVNVTRKAGKTNPAGAPTPPWLVFTPETVAYGMPVDPWGQPYQFFNRQGRFDETPGSSTASAGLFDATVQSLVFDRPTILSTGPNGLPGDGTTNSPYGAGDDLYKQF